MRNLSIILLLLLAIPSHATGTEEGVIKPTSEQPCVSPDGTRLAFVSDAASSDDIWVAKRDGTDSRILTPWPNTSERHPDWSPDGSRIVFCSTKDASNMNIWVINSDGTNPERLTSEADDNKRPRYSPDGSQIVFVSNRTGKNELWVMQSDGASQRLISSTTLKVSDPGWSPDGESLVFVGTRKNSSNLFVIKLDGSGLNQITSGDFYDWYPDWGQGGIAFTSNRGDFLGVWSITSDGTDLHALTSENAVGDFDPRWDKSSGLLLFSRTGGSDLAVSNVFSVDNDGIVKKLTQINGFIQTGDVNSDGNLDCNDLATVKASFGQKTGQPGFDGRADTNLDGVIDIRDLSFVSRKLPAGTTCP